MVPSRRQQVPVGIEAMAECTLSLQTVRRERRVPAPSGFSPNDSCRSRDGYLERRVDLPAFRGAFRPVVAER